MNQTDKENTTMTNMEQLQKDASACGAGCGCHAGGGSGRGRWVVGAVVLLIAAVLVVRAATKGGDTRSSQSSESAFGVASTTPASPVVRTASIAEAPAAPAATAVVVAGEVAAVEPATPAAPVAAKAAADDDAVEATPVICGETIQGLGDLNSKATDKDGVFVFLAGKDAAKARAAAAVVEKAATTIGASGVKVGVFTVGEGSPEYANLATQVPPPGVIAMAKGRGASVVSGEITEAKLMQAFVAASSGGGCGSAGGGCGSAGCK